MSQAKVNNVVSKIRVNVGPRRRFSNPEGPEGRLLMLRQTVTALIKHERIELNYHLGDETRGYAERLISDAIRYGETHNKTMDVISYWLTEKQLVHKMFKVLVPRYQDSTLSYTQMWKAPTTFPGKGKEKCVLELRGNIYPKFVQSPLNNKNLLHNILLDGARRDFQTKQEFDKTKNEIDDNAVTTILSDSEMKTVNPERIDLHDSGSVENCEKNI